MKLDVLNLNGEKIKDINLDKEIFGIEPNNKVLKDAIVVAQSSLRQGTAKTKTRSEVRGGGRKPWKQKGTGNARQGSIRAVQWVGGGVALGPVPRTYNKKQNRKERKLALRSAYSFRAQGNNVLVVDTLNFETPKTKEMIKVLKNLNVENNKVLLIVKEYNDNVILSSRNLPNVFIEKANEVSVLDLLTVNKVIIEQNALEDIKEVLK